MGTLTALTLTSIMWPFTRANLGPNARTPHNVLRVLYIFKYAILNQINQVTAKNCCSSTGWFICLVKLNCFNIFWKTLSFVLLLNGFTAHSFRSSIHHVVHLGFSLWACVEPGASCSLLIASVCSVFFSSFSLNPYMLLFKYLQYVQQSRLRWHGCCMSSVTQLHNRFVPVYYSPGNWQFKWILSYNFQNLMFSFARLIYPNFFRVMKSCIILKML